MKILIVGSSAKSYCLVKKILSDNPNVEIFVLPESKAILKNAKMLDISASSTNEILEFALKNEIDLTIVLSEDAILKDIANSFNEAGLSIFAPTLNSGRICVNKSSAKKFMYRLKIPTPKFGIYDKESQAIEYAKKSHYPLMVKTDNHQEGENVVFCENFKQAKRCIQKFFDEFNKKIVIEDYIDGEEYSFYYLSDGYNLLDFSSTMPYKYADNDNSGIIKTPSGAYAPDIKLSNDLKNKIKETLIKPLIIELAENKNPYLGILGADIVIDKNGHFFVIEFNYFLNEADCECVLNLLEDNILNLIIATITGTLKDEYEQIKFKNAYATSVLVELKNKENDEVLNEIEQEAEVSYFNERKFYVTAVSNILKNSCEKVYDVIDLLQKENRKYRTDIGKFIERD